MTPHVAILLSLSIPLMVALGAALWVCIYLGRDLLTGLWLVLKCSFYILLEIAKHEKRKKKTRHNYPDEISETGLTRYLHGDTFFASEVTLENGCKGCFFFKDIGGCTLSDSVKVVQAANCLPNQRNNYKYLIWEKAPYAKN